MTSQVAISGVGSGHNNDIWFGNGSRSDTRVGRDPKLGRSLFKRQVDENVGSQRVPWVGG